MSWYLLFVGPLWAADVPATLPSGRGVSDQVELDKNTDPIYAIIFQVWAGGSQREAERMLRQVVPENSNNVRLVFFQAVCARVRSGDSSGRQQLDRVVAMAPDSPEGQCASQLIRLETRANQAPALAELKRIADANASNSLILLALGNSYYAAGKYDKSLACCEGISNLIIPGPPQLHHLWANSLHMLQRYDEALPHRKTALQLEEGAWSHGALASTLQRLHQYDEANDEYAKAVAIYSAPEHWYGWASNLYSQRRYDEAAVKYQRATELDPQDPAKWIAWGCALRENGDTEEALSKFQRARELTPNQVAGYRYAFLMLQRLGRDDDAQKIQDEWKRNGDGTALDR